MNLKHVLIEITGRLAHIQPPDNDVVTRCAISYEINGYGPGGAHGYVSTQERRHLPEEYDLSGRLILPAKAVPQAKARLHAAGYNVEIRTGHQADPAWAPLQSALVSAPASLQALVKTLAAQPSGIVEFVRDATVIDAAVVICRALPNARIFIMAATRKKVRQLNVALDNCIGFAIGMAGSKRDGEDWRVVVGTPERVTDYVQQYRNAVGTGDSITDLDNGRPGRDILLVSDAEQIATQAYARALLMSRAPRAYAFLRAGLRLDFLQREFLTIFFGPTVWREAGPEGPRADVQVVFVQPDVGAVPRTKTPLERKRLRIWHNEQRNDFLAGLANAMALRDRERMWGYGLFLGSAEEAFFTGMAPSVTVLVESAEHGRQLQKRLPGWELWDAMTLRNGDNEPSVPVDPFKIGPLHQVILTLAGTRYIKDDSDSDSDRVNIETDVVIRADGTEWPLGLEGFPPQTQQAQRTVLLIDLADDHDRESRDATRRRLRDYRRRGWDVQGTPAWLRQEQLVVASKVTET